MKFVFFTDTHFTQVSPSRYRMDNYGLALQSKLEHVVKVINQSDFGVFGGDFFDTHASVRDFSLLSGIIVTLLKLRKPVYYIWGNHDLDGHNRESREASTFHFISRFIPMLQELKPNQMIDGVKFCASNAWDELPVGSVKGSKVSVGVLHHLLTPNEQKYDSYVIGKLSVPFRLCLSGDFHGQFVEEVGPTIFANSGALARRSKNEKHSPSYLMVRIVGKRVKVDRVEVPHKPYDEVYSESLPDTESDDKVEDDGLDDFAKTVQELEVESVDIFDLIERLSKKKTVKVRKRVLRYILSKRG